MAVQSSGRPVAGLGVAVTRGCRINPRRARWIRSKGGLRKRPSPPSRADRRLRSRRAQPLWHPLPRACSGLSETTLCDSLDEEQASRVLANPLAEFAHCDSERTLGTRLLIVRHGG